MLLIHHLFYDYAPEYYKDIMLFTYHGNPYGLFHILSYICKTTVWVFVILSGYGLFKSYKGSTLNFYKKRYWKLYRNYWFIWLCFVPIGIFIFHRTFEVVYGTSNYMPYLIKNLLGVHLFWGFLGYNPTWWFISLIIFLYAIYPIIQYILSLKHKIIPIFVFILLFIATIFKIRIGHCHLYFSSWYLTFILPFYLGAICAQYNIFEKAKKYCKKFNINYLLLILIIILSIIRAYCTFKYDAGAGSPVDTLLAYSIIQYSYNVIDVQNICAKFTEILGKHSFNIFLFHTFIFGMFFTKFVYCFKYPIIILIVFTFLCVGISLILEEFKKILTFVTKKVISEIRG